MKYIITGANFGNKGAESMLYTLITQLREKDPDSLITVILNYGRDDINSEDFKNITFLKDDFRIRRHLLSNYLRFTDNIKMIFKKNEILLKWDYEFRSCDAILDASGYALSSQWGAYANRNLLYTLKLAKKYNKKVILFPQSFGPFDYTKEHKISIKDVKEALKYANLIFCREKDGYEKLKAFDLNNIYLSNDMVLESTKPYKDIYKSEIRDYETEIPQNSALIIPSIRIYERCDKDKFLNLYKKAIDYMLENNYKVFLSYYDIKDSEVCEYIKGMFKENENVQYISDDLNCIQYSRILPRFKFLITSRFHSAVHAYKNHVPCIVVGWAIKYKELTENLGQQEFLFDCRQEIDEDDFVKKVEYIIQNRESISETIKEHVNKIQENCCFDKVWEVLYG